MKEKHINTIKYYIRPRMKKRWFLSDIKVYDLIENTQGKEWIDPSYGNGGGDFIDFDREEVLYTFNTFHSADTMRQELTEAKK